MMTSMKSLASLCLVSCLLTSCDIERGVESYAKLARPVDPNCIDRTLSALPMIGDVKRLSPQGASFGNWTYSAGGAFAIINLSQDGDDITFTNAVTRMGSPPPESDLEAARRIIPKVDAALSEACAFSPKEDLRARNLNLKGAWGFSD